MEISAGPFKSRHTQPLSLVNVKNTSNGIQTAIHNDYIPAAENQIA